ncbi:MAG: hypothetical protein SFX19_10020 [Alphaproteobacteria bacterium]|nr:hypothetical protein [Alphaproteobacteria bacterium]
MTAQILLFETPVERALKKACRQLSTAYDHGLCDDDLYFSTIESLDAAIERRRLEAIQRRAA